MRNNPLACLLFLLCSLIANVSMAAEDAPRIVVLAFQLHDQTELPNAPEELKRVELLSATFKNQLSRHGVEMVAPSAKVLDEINKHSPSYLFDNVQTAVELNRDAQADYLIIGVAFKPTYLFVYPRLLLVDMKTGKVVMSKYAQLESSWSDQNTTVRTGEKLAGIVQERLELLQKGNHK